MIDVSGDAARERPHRAGAAAAVALAAAGYQILGAVAAAIGVALDMIQSQLNVVTLNGTAAIRATKSVADVDG